jgi:ribonuclease E
MGSKMLIDAAHPEETRVVVVNGNRVDEFDFESETKKQLRGNIYLARVTRVEPSLQAAFVEYGGNRHGFLAFSEIHPDYYQIPVADREALLKQYYEEERREEEEEDSSEKSGEENAESAAGDEAESAPGEQDGEEDSELENDGEAVASDDTVEDVGAGDALEEISTKKERRSQRSYKIQEVIKRRQILLVQVVKEERGNKGAALTT